MNIEKYLHRIQYKGSLEPTLNVLNELQRLHLLNVPFENLDIHYGNPIILDLGKVYQKVVERNRGGFCYELNGLFSELLKNLGFKSKIISARVYDSRKEEYGAEFDHLAIIVEVNQVEYLVDVGFGEFTLRPIKLDLNKPQEDNRGTFLIEKFENEYYKVSKLIEGRKSPQYIFTQKARNLAEFNGMCNYHQTSPESHFTRKKLITKPSMTGRVTITGNLLKITEKDVVTKEIEFKEEDYRNQLLKYFNLNENEIRHFKLIN